ncbi:MAG: hypothetical protein RBG13Loki_1369 [Promethearchaeota archaeon CR_4]|nr:MAG: hypothetical protein RBG13Loki_1369 [Candidatus Lokiarchaeota archaeon CR_4]
MASEHLKFVIPGAICCAVGGILLLYGGLFTFIYRMTGVSGSMMGKMGTAAVIIGIIFLCIGIVVLAKGINIYKNKPTTSYAAYNRPMQTISYTHTPTPSPTPVPTPSPAAPSVSLDTVNTKIPGISDKKYCPSCGAPLPDHFHPSFCPQCGGPV